MQDSNLKLGESLLKDGTSRGALCAGKTFTLLLFSVGFGVAFLLNLAPVNYQGGAVSLSGDEDEGGGEEEGGVKNWMSEKGFGFIAPKNGGEDLFCHVRSLTDGEGSVEKGDLVTFTKNFNDRKGKYEAADVRLKEKGGAMDMIGGGGGGGGGGEEQERKEGMQGIMERWLGEKGFGFIAPHEGGDNVFCHFRNLADGDGSVKEGDPVIYTAQFNSRKGKYEAVDVKIDPNPPEPPAPTPAPPGEEGKGILMRWNTEKGYGFIMPDGGGDDLFCHAKSLKNGENSVEEGDFVIYVTQFNARKQKFEATEVEKDPNPPVEEEPEAFSGGPGNHVHHHIHHHIHHHNHNNDDV